MLNSILNFFLLCAIIFSEGCAKPKSPTDSLLAEPYKNPNIAIDERVEDLLARMTLSEKVGQMTQVDRGQLKDIRDIQKYALGSLLSGGGSAPADNTADGWANMYDEFQSIALKNRLGIPLIYGIDAVHGHNNVYGAVIFPHNIGLGCMRDAELVERAARATAEEVAGTGIDWTFAPCVTVPRDERWGRTYEGFAETPELVKEMAAAAVRGFQGFRLNDEASILACAKHYLGDGGAIDGKDQGDINLDEATLRELHLQGYISAIEAGVGSVMAAYNSWHGQKNHGNQYLLTTVLRNELGFDGILVSDWSAIDQLPGDYASDIEQAINAGLDMIMVPDKYEEFILKLTHLVEQSKVPVTRIDEAVRRILKIKFEMGLFEHPYTNRQFTKTIGSEKHRQTARQCVRQSLVLLKNEGNILPLAKTANHIHVAGKNADDLGSQCGGWSITWQGHRGDITIGTTILEAIRASVSPKTTVSFSQDGSNASGSEIAIVCIGEAPYAEGQGDSSDLSLAAEDVAVIKRLKNLNIPIVVILISGRPMIVDSILNDCEALIAAWLPGTEGLGIADVLFGDYAPTGKLSFSWPRSMAQIPINYGDANYQPLFEYGFGLTY